MLMYNVFQTDIRTAFLSWVTGKYSSTPPAYMEKFKTTCLRNSDFISIPTMASFYPTFVLTNRLIGLYTNLCSPICISCAEYK